MVSIGANNVMKLWTVDGLSLLKTFSGFSSQLVDASFISSSLLVLALTDWVQILDRDAREVAKIPKPEGAIVALALSTDSRLVAVSTNHGVVQVFDAALFECVITFNFDKVPVKLRFASSYILIVGLLDAELFAIDVISGEVVMKALKHAEITGLACTTVKEPETKQAIKHNLRPADDDIEDEAQQKRSKRDDGISLHQQTAGSVNAIVGEGKLRHDDEDILPDRDLSTSDGPSTGSILFYN